MAGGLLAAGTMEKFGKNRRHMVTPSSVIDTKILEGIICYLQSQASPKQIWEIERALPDVNI
jgi:hypothetical protein